MVTCRKCGAENTSIAKFCQICANPLAELEVVGGNTESLLFTTATLSLDPPGPQICPVCDAENESEWAFCKQCGSNLRQSSGDVASKMDKPAASHWTNATTVRALQLLDELKKASVSGVITCPKCSQPAVSEAVFCHKCGSAISSARAVAMSSPKALPDARLLVIVDGEVTGDEFEIRGDTVIGRINGDITFPHDDYMSGQHARITKRGKKFMLIDEDSRNGSFIRIKKEVEIEPGDFVLLGKQLFRFEV